MQVKKATLQEKGTEGLTVIFFDTPKDRKKRKTTLEDETPVHADLIQSYQNLAIHFAILTGYVQPKQVKNIKTPDPKLTEGFWINGLSVKSGDDPGVIISGHRKLENGKAVILNTPFQRLQEGEETAYKYQDDLNDKLERAEEEISAFIDGTKKGDDPQMGLFDGQEAQERMDSENVTEEELEEMTTEGDAEVWKDGQRPNV